MRLRTICGALVLLAAACSSGGGSAGGNTGGSGGAGKCTSSQDCAQPGAMCAYADCVQGQCQIKTTPGCGVGGSAGSDAGDAGECVVNQDCPQPGAMCLYAECVGGQCQLKSTPGCGTGGSGGDAGGSCPPMEPTPSSACTVEQSGFCYFGSSICSCDAQGGFVQDGGVSYAWDCGTAPAGCPSTVPSTDAPCTLEGQSCSYDYRPCAQSNPSKFICQGSVWVYSATPCG